MKGWIKTGKRIFIGNAGEYYVMAELLKRGIVAALAPRNTPAFDILATKGDSTIKIRVKTKSQEISDWQWAADKDGNIFRNMSKDGDFVVMVDLTEYTKNLKFYIIKTHKINGILEKGFDDWVNTPGKNGHIRDPENKKRNLSQKTYSDELSKCLNQWEKLWE